MNFYEAADGFLIERRYNRQIGDRTRQLDRENLLSVGTIVEKVFPECIDDVSQLTKEKIKLIIRHMVDKGLADKTILLRVITLRMLIAHLASEGIMENTCKNIQFKIRQKNTITPFSISQLQAMFKALATKDLEDIRTMALVKLMLDTGGRLMEIERLDISHVDLENRTVFFAVRKNDKSAYVPFGEETRKCLKKYLRAFSIDQTELNEPFFQEEDGQHMKRRTIQRRIQELGKRANIQNVRCSPHTFRHTFAILFLLNGGCSSVLKIYLDHNSMETVELYVNITKAYGEKLFKSGVDFASDSTSPVKLFSESGHYKKQALN